MRIAVAIQPTIAAYSVAAALPDEAATNSQLRTDMVRHVGAVLNNTGFVEAIPSPTTEMIGEELELLLSGSAPQSGDKRFVIVTDPTALVSSLAAGDTIEIGSEGIGIACKVVEQVLTHVPQGGKYLVTVVEFAEPVMKMWWRLQAQHPGRGSLVNNLVRTFAQKLQLPDGPTTNLIYRDATLPPLSSPK